MAPELLTLNPTEDARVELKSYNETIPMGSLAIGVDNIHHDVFLSPKFVQSARDYLFDLIKQGTKAKYFPGIELRAVKAPDNAAFRKILTDLLQSSLTHAKFHKNIEIDLLFRLALLKFLTAEIAHQFSNLILEGKEWIRQRGEHFERSQQAHVIKSRLSELQSARRGVVRAVGQEIALVLTEVEENVISKARRALFGDDFAPLYDLLKNKLVFLDGGKDDVFFLEHYVLLGNYARDSDRFEAMDELFQDFIGESGLGMAQEPAYVEAKQAHQNVLELAQAMRTEIANLEEQRESLRKRLDRGESFLNKFLSQGDPADMKASLNDIESRLKHQETKLEEIGPQIEAARQKVEFFTKDYKGKLGDFLNDPENAKRMFDQTSVAVNEDSERGKLLAALLDRLEQQEIIYHVMASYEIRPLLETYCPPVHL